MKLVINRRFIPSNLLIAGVLFAAMFLIGAPLLTRIGTAWDEPDNIYSGGQYARFFAQGFDPSTLTARDPSSSIFGKLIFSQEVAIARYPPFPNMIGTLIAQGFALIGGTLTGPDIILAFHAATLLFFALLVSCVFLFARKLGLPVWVSLFAAGLTAGNPTLWGHGVSNLKDTAQVALFTVTLYVLFRFTIRGQLNNLLAAGTVWGLAVASKFNAVYVPVIWTATLLATRMIAKPPRGRVSFVHILLFLTLGAVVCVVAWPYLWFDPIGRFAEVITYFTTVGQGYKLFWNGTLYEVGTGKSLWWYPWMNILLSTPLPVLFLLAVGLATNIGLIVRRSPGVSGSILLLVWFFVPPLRAILPHAAFYDGMRHFMEILPAASLLAAIGLWNLTTILQRRYRTPLAQCQGLALGVLAHLVFINALYFPYSTGYLNILARNPNKQYDRDIEALSVREAVDYLHKTKGTIALWSPIGGHLTWYYLGEEDQYVYNAAEADSIILVNKSSHILRHEFERRLPAAWKLTHTISRGDAEFAWIYTKR